MPSRQAIKTTRWLQDILRQIELAQTFIENINRTDFEVDVLRFYAVTRCLEIISEASRRLPDALKERHPLIPWKDIAGAGNVYRHDYEDVSADYVWQTVQKRLPSLLEVITIELSAIDGQA